MRKGIIQEIPIRWKGKELEEIVAQEKQVIKDNGGLRQFVFSNSTLKLPEGYSRSSITGFPLNPKRTQKDKVLRPGFYFYWPILDDIVKESQQVEVIPIDKFSVPLADDFEFNVEIGCNIRYKVLRYDKAYLAVKDYEASLKDFATGILSKHCRARPKKDWINKEVLDKIEEDAATELRKIVTEDWGLKIFQMYLTDIALVRSQKVFYDGPPIAAKMMSPDIPKSTNFQ